MPRLIDADSLVKRIEETKCDWNEKTAPISWNHAYDSFIDIIDEQPAIGGWISVNDRLPDIGEVITAVKYSGKRGIYVQTGEWTGESWVSVWDEYMVSDVKKEVLYWMPLPSTEGLQDG